MDGLNTGIKNPRWQMATILNKKSKNYYILATASLRVKFGTVMHVDSELYQKFKT